MSKASADDFTRATLRGKSDDILQTKKRIYFTDLAKTKDGEPAQLVLVEGAPGIGKSTFAWEACRRWGAEEILQQYKLMVLLRLRERRVQQAKTISDLFHYSRDSHVKLGVVKEVENGDGAGVLLVFEGFDELPSQMRTEDSFFMDIIKGESLPKATVLITSRHWASRPLLLNDELHRPLSQHIEILGFTKKDIEEYLECMTFDDPSLLSGLQKYLSCYPNISSMMYIPLNCVIVLEVYRESRSDKKQLIPKTMTELYTSLVRTLLLRYLHDHSEYRDSCTKLLNFSDLPDAVYDQFCELTRIAYEGICNDEQIIFSDLPDGFETLGLMQCVPELYVDQGTVVSYNFLHLTLQEYLAAYHVSLMTSEMQVEHLINSEDSMLLKFIAGLTKLDFKEDELNRFTQVKLEAEYSLFHWLFEAQDTSLLHKLYNNVIISVDSYHSQGLFDFFVLGYCVSHNNRCKWDITLEKDEQVDMFVRGAAGCNALSCGKIVSLSISGYSESVTSLPVCLFSELTMFEWLAGDGLNDLAKLVSHTPQLHELNLSECIFKPGSVIQLFDSLSSVKSFTTLNLSCTYLEFERELHPEDCQALCRLLSTSHSLTSLDICGRELDSGMEYIINAVSHLQDLSISSITLSSRDIESLSSMLKTNQTLVFLYIRNCEIDSFGAHSIADGLCSNDCLRTLDMDYNPIKDQGATTLAQMLTINRSLTELRLENCHITEVGASHLASALATNHTITHVSLVGNNFDRFVVYDLRLLI